MDTIRKRIAAIIGEELPWREEDLLEFADKIIKVTDALYKSKYLGMLPEEKVMKPSTTKEEADNPLLLFEDGKLVGFNLAIQEMKGRMG
jgi:hypothetical protein